MGEQQYSEGTGFCPFCDRKASVENGQGVSVCKYHKRKRLEKLTCSCGNWIQILRGSEGAFGRCLDCGPMSIKKVLKLNPQRQEEREEITVRSDELGLY